MSRLRHWILALAMPTYLLTSPLVAGPSRPLSFADRVEAARAIERAYFSHLVGAPRAFEQVVPDTQLEHQVSTYLKQSAALEIFWSTRVTPEMLEGELNRIARDTRFPDRLEEIYAALGHDSFLIQECFARPVLVDRLARAFEARDERVKELSWDEWWRDVEPEIDGGRVAAVAHASTGLPRPGLPAGGPTSAEALTDTCLPDDTWTSAFRDGTPPDPRSTGTAIWTGSLLVIWGGDSQPSGGRYDPLTDTWRQTTLTGAPGQRVRHSAIWTGSEMIVWGGSGANGTYQDGARYDPVADTWQPISSAGAPTARYRHSAVWTGSEMIVWGGQLDNYSLTVTGGRYDPSSDTWAPIEVTGAPMGRIDQATVWTGSHLVVWGGYDPGSGQRVNTGGRYAPATDTWTPTGTAGAPTPRQYHTAVWTGSRMLVWGGLAGAFAPANTNTGGSYDPVSDTWALLPVPGAPTARYSHAASWTGARMWIWGGSDTSGTMATTGALYDPVSGSWSAVAGTNQPAARRDAQAVWTGSLVLYWGGFDGIEYLNTGGRYAPATNTWTPLSDGGVPSPRWDHTAVWTGRQMLVWGGRDWGIDFAGYLDTGGRYDPLTNSWSPTSLLGAPAHRGEHTAVWTGDRMIVWGGRTQAPSGNGRLNTGGLYDPISDTWSPTESLHAPSPRTHHTAVWTGQWMLVWGGEEGSESTDVVNTGKMYNPVSQNWITMSTVGAPSARTRHSGVWTGDELLIWGGAVGSFPVGTGGRFDPQVNAWSSMSVVGAPEARWTADAAWTGAQMLVWGGATSNSFLATGGRYDPSADHWSPMATLNSPAARRGEAVGWTNGRFILWGGEVDWVLSRTGGRYDPIADAWEPTAVTDSPQARYAPTMVWTGRSVLIWGGDTGTGGEYVDGQSRDFDGDGVTPCAGDCDDLEALRYPGNVEACDGLDSNCDFVRPADEADNDYDDYPLCAGDCNDNDATRHPGAVELCDNVDNDCNGIKDQFPTACGVGACAATGVCTAGNDTCLPGAPSAESCDGLDNDCNGIVDGYVSSCGVGACARTGLCSAGVDSCIPGSAVPEVCNALDDNCDGLLPADEQDPDGDGVAVCAGDCAPDDATRSPVAPEINDAADNQCPGSSGAGLVDEISGSSGFSNPADPTQFCWPPQSGALEYEVLRSSSQQATGSCLRSRTSSNCWSDAATPPARSAYFYLVRATLLHVGSWGAGSSQVERAVSCGSEQQCADAIDDDGDGRTDCADTADCYGTPGCPSAVFTFVDTPANDISNLALAAFLAELPVGPGDYIHVALAGGGLPGFEWCAQQAEFYRDAYLAWSPTGGNVTPGGWSLWQRPEGNPWSEALTDDSISLFGDQCLGLYSWCSEVGLESRSIAVVPGDTASCEASDLAFSCGDGTAGFSLTIGTSRQAACGF